MSEVINAFHPDYMKTYEPNFTKEFRTIAANQADRLANPVKVNRKTVQAKKKKKVSYKIPKQTAKPRGAALEALKKRILEAKPYHTFAKAGMPKGVH
jgi:hypothetical protein